MNTPIESEAPQYKTIKQMAARYPAFSDASIRWHVFNADTNGLSKSIIRIGKKVLIDAKEFEIWIESHRQNKVNK